jgi:hypothetical protein
MAREIFSPLSGVMGLNLLVGWVTLMSIKVLRVLLQGIEGSMILRRKIWRSKRAEEYKDKALLDVHPYFHRKSPSRFNLVQFTLVAFNTGGEKRSLQ